MMGKQTHGTCSRLVAYLLAAALAMGCANGCSPKLAAPEEKKQLALALPDAAYDQQVRNSPAYVAAKKDGWQLLVDGASAVVTVQAPDGRRWSSNPEDRLAEHLPAGEPLGMLGMRFLSVSTAIIPCRMGSGFPISWGGSRRLICSRQPFLPRGLRNSAPA